MTIEQLERIETDLEKAKQLVRQIDNIDYQINSALTAAVIGVRLCWDDPNVTYLKSLDFKSVRHLMDLVVAQLEKSRAVLQEKLDEI